MTKMRVKNDKNIVRAHEHLRKMEDAMNRDHDKASKKKVGCFWFWCISPSRRSDMYFGT